MQCCRAHPSNWTFRGRSFFLVLDSQNPPETSKGIFFQRGRELREEFAKLLNVNSSDYDLKTLADEVAAKFDLYHILYQLFTVQELQKHQNDILELSWLRIYTTNFDDAVEFFHTKKGNKLSSYSYYDEKPRKLAHGSIIHLHGTIRDTNAENISQQLILNEASYVRQHFERSPWYDDFIRDLRFCGACYFVGYSLSDYHITALLMQNPNIREKTYFITRIDPDQIFSNQVKQYGQILPIGTDGFAELCRTLPKTEHNVDPYTLKAFQYLDPFKDKRTLSPPTANEILNLVTYGTFNYQRCLATLPGGEYVVPRQRLAVEAAAQLIHARCLLVHSRIGNGKKYFPAHLGVYAFSTGLPLFLVAFQPASFAPRPRNVEIIQQAGDFLRFV